jgi:hypothetical protein
MFELPISIVKIITTILIGPINSIKTAPEHFPAGNAPAREEDHNEGIFISWQIKTRPPDFFRNKIFARVARIS